MKATSIVAVIMFGLAGGVLGVTVPMPFDTKPFNTQVMGNVAANFRGSFRQNGGPEQLRYFLGTEAIPGRLIMKFAVPFTDGPGDDFAILTSSEGWGPSAGMALFEFFLGGNLQTSLTLSLASDRLFQFDLPGIGIIADGVVVSNLTPDPPGVNDLASMTFDDAGAAYVVPDPTSSIGLLLMGICSLLVISRFMTGRFPCRAGDSVAWFCLTVIETGFCHARLPSSATMHYGVVAPITANSVLREVQVLKAVKKHEQDYETQVRHQVDPPLCHNAGFLN